MKGRRKMRVSDGFASQPISIVINPKAKIRDMTLFVASILFKTDIVMKKQLKTLATLSFILVACLILENLTLLLSCHVHFYMARGTENHQPSN
jgi:hypothetical protein